MKAACLIFWPVLIFYLAACSMISKEECNIADWKERGYEDALQGYAMPVMLSEYKDTCDAPTERPDEEAYREGFALGEKSFDTKAETNLEQE